MPDGPVLLVAGTRPEVIKLAPLYRELAADGRYRPYWVSVQQHRQLLDIALADFRIVPDCALDLRRSTLSLSELAASVMKSVDRVLAKVAPACVVVQGDTTTAAVSAMCGLHRQAPVVHLEAGLRSGDLRSPFPEEANRRLISSIASLHLAPTRVAVRNLRLEGVRRDRIVLTGNTVTDAARLIDSELKDGGGPDRWGVFRKSYDSHVLVTAHRREAWDEGLSNVATAVKRFAASFPETAIFWPLHPNPLVETRVAHIVEDCPNIFLTGPVGYGDLIAVLKGARLTISDSGGLQEEAPSLGVPVLVARDNTERPEGIEAGTAVLVGTQEEAILSWATKLMTDGAVHRAMARAHNPYGDGFAAPRCVDAIDALVSSVCAG